jgi:hypothetical protein
MLRQEIDRLEPGLFDKIDRTDVFNLDDVFETTQRLEHLARDERTQPIYIV